ncbi:hypothetical protein [Spiroplasma turonicum]|uniref:Transmembrane protein n=1 Tax=Spiroplasma turonicum TaxID=216946 RepID=A0A0K1P795_9MOLU|nr:hypothetical protein [Spiroplasma turonicum]AKU80160.1 hypothetical protein STURON_00914 [Spiroplasma turonicum]ALX71160.1 hypothetical protein STURO_v1c09090 [Spiroplasma turonicum]
MILAELSKSTSYILLSAGIAGLIVGILATLFFIKFYKIKKLQKKSFDITPGNYKIFRFWQYYGIIILALTGYIMFLVLVPIAIEKLI